MVIRKDSLSQGRRSLMYWSPRQDQRDTYNDIKHLLKSIRTTEQKDIFLPCSTPGTTLDSQNSLHLPDQKNRPTHRESKDLWNIHSQLPSQTSPHSSWLLNPLILTDELARTISPAPLHLDKIQRMIHPYPQSRGQEAPSLPAKRIRCKKE